MSRDLICPFTECNVYKNWASLQKRDEQIYIIYLEEKYKCLAKEVTEYSVTEGGILWNEEIKERLTNTKFECALIEVLNK